MIWSIIQVIGKQGISVVVFAVLAALLPPEDFGLIGMAIIWIAFLDSFFEAGFGSALIQRQNVTDQHYSSVFALNIVMGICLTIFGIALSWPAALLFQTPALQPVMAVLSLGFLMTALSLTQVSLAQKELRFKDLAIRDVISTSISGIAGISAALYGLGVWSLVIQTLTTYVINTVTLWSISHWRPTMRSASFAHIKELWSYSSKLFMFNVVKFFSQNTDKFFISLLLGTFAMGMYTFAFKWTALPIATFVGAVSVYLFPLFSKMQKEKSSITDAYILTVKSINVVIVPVLVGIILLAPIVVPLIWGDTWLQAIPLIQIFCILALAHSLLSPVGQVLKALNKPSWLLLWSIGFTVLAAIALPLAAHYYDIIGAAWAMTGIYIISLPINFIMLQKLINLRVRDIVTTFGPSSIAGGIMAIFIFVILLFNQNIASLLFGCIGGLSLYAATIWIIDKPLVVTIYRYIKGFFPTAH